MNVLAAVGLVALGLVAGVALAWWAGLPVSHYVATIRPDFRLPDPAAGPRRRLRRRAACGAPTAVQVPVVRIVHAAPCRGVFDQDDPEGQTVWETAD